VKNHPAIKVGDYFKIIIRDDGCGMDEAVLAQAFEPYFTTKEKGMGTGMGLATVLGTVKGHGGSIHLTNAPSEGTTCEILLPIFEQPEADALGRHVHHVDLLSPDLLAKRSTPRIDVAYDQQGLSGCEPEAESLFRFPLDCRRWCSEAKPGVASVPLAWCCYLPFN
jgi:hypothetical protein